MSKKMLIDASVPDETRVVLVGDQGKILDVDFDNVERRQIKSNIYLARVTRVEPSLQAAFVDYGGNRHGFLPFSEIHPDYFQIPIADRERLMEEAREHRESKRRAKAPEPSEDDSNDDEEAPAPRSKRRSAGRKDKSESQRRRKRPSLTAEERAAEAQATEERAAAGQSSPANDQIDAEAAGAEAAGAEAAGAEAGQAERLDLPVYSDDSEQPDIGTPITAEAASESTSNGSDGTDGDAGSDQDPRSQAMATRPEDLQDSLVGDVAEISEVAGAANISSGHISSGHDATDAPVGQAEADVESGQAGSAEASGDGEPNLADELERMIEPRGRRRRPGKGKPTQSRGAKKRTRNKADEAADASTAEGDELALNAVADEEAKADANAAPSTAEESDDKPSGNRPAKGSRIQDDEDDEDEALVEVYSQDDDNGDELDDDDDDDKDDEQDEVRLSHAFLARRYKIQEVIKRRQIMLIQINKEERGNKGAALTTYLSLPGRYCVLMPNTPKGGGISRKISNPRDRRKLKQILEELSLPTSLSVIVRTAGSKQDKAEIQRDYEYLLRTWDEIRKTTLESTAPALIYEEGNIIKRAVRDMYTTDCSEIVVEGKRGYEIARKMMHNLMPDQLEKVQLHDDSRQSVMQSNGVEAKLEDLHKPSVSLKSGGYLVINQTEALVAIDINSGKATRERSIEDTALKTNLEAADEIARQLRLRQMAGLVVIDFIDMEERRHNRQVEKRLRDALAGDRARIQVGQISNFGLLELSRQRLGPSLHEIYRTTCEHCGGLGHVRGSSAVVRAILRSLEAAMNQQEGAEKVSITCSTRLGMDLLNDYRRQLSELEDRYSMRIEVKLNPDFHAEDFTISDSGTSNNNRRRRNDSDDTDDESNDRRKPSRSRDDRRGKPRGETRDSDDDDSDDDEDEDSKSRRRRGRRGGRKRRRSDEDGELENGNDRDNDSDDDDDNDEAESDRSRGSRRGRGQRNERNGRRRRDERKPFFARSFDELLNTDREPRDRRQRGENAGRGGRNQRQDRNRQPSFAGSFDDLLNTDRELRERRGRGDRRRRTNEERDQVKLDAQTQATAAESTATVAPSASVEPAAEPAVAMETQTEAQGVSQNVSQDVSQALSQAEPSATTPQASASDISVSPSEATAATAADASGTATSDTPPVEEAEQAPKPNKPKRRGWWNLGR